MLYTTLSQTDTQRRVGCVVHERGTACEHYLQPTDNVQAHWLTRARALAGTQHCYQQRPAVLAVEEDASACTRHQSERSGSGNCGARAVDGLRTCPRIQTQRTNTTGGNGFGHWLGTGNLRTNEFLPFEEALLHVHALHLNNVNEWELWCKNVQPGHISSNQKTAYKHDRWQGYGHWLGTSAVAGKNKKTSSFCPSRRRCCSHAPLSCKQRKGGGRGRPKPSLHARRLARGGTLAWYGLASRGSSCAPLATISFTSANR